MQNNEMARGILPIKVEHRKLCLLLPPVVLVFMAFLAAPSLAALTHPLKTTVGPFTDPSGIAIDGANGNVFIAENGSIKITGPEGGPPSDVAVDEIGGIAVNEPVELAIDNSATSPSRGTLYVTDRPSKSVRTFALNPITEEYEEEEAVTATPSFGQPLGIAIDSSGNVFVSDRPFPLESADGLIIKFSPSGDEIWRKSLTAPIFGTSSLAFDSAGNLFARSHYGLGVYKLDANGSGEVESSASPNRILTGSPTGIAVDLGTDTLYLTNSEFVSQYAANCAPVSAGCVPEREFGAGSIRSSRNISVSPLNGDIYVVDQGAGSGSLAIFARTLATIPDVETQATTRVKLSSATLNGTLNADGGPPAECKFEYTTKADFEAEGFSGAIAVPCVPTGPFAGNITSAVKTNLNNLNPATTYAFRLLSSNENGPSPGAVLFFATVGLPEVDATAISTVTLHSAKIKGLVSPNGGPGAEVETTYAVEYVSDADFKINAFVNAITVPTGGQGIGSGINPIPVEQLLSGLSPLVTYHSRIAAKNEAGEVKGADVTFTTYSEPASFSGCPNESLRESLGSTFIPDCRAYEQATPINKNGNNALGSASQVQAGPLGDRILYTARGGIPGSEGAQTFDNYLATRSFDWVNQGLLPPAGSGSSAATIGWAEDLSQAYVAKALFSGSPADFLQRDSGSHALRLIASEGAVGTSQAFAYIGSSTDSSVVFFESASPLVAGSATKGINIYAWDRSGGELTLAGSLNTSVAPTKGTLAGSNEPLFRRHYLQAQHTVSDDGSRVFFSDAGTGQLYVRQNPTQPQSALQAGSCVDPVLACTTEVSASKAQAPDPNGKKPAVFWGATPDGSKAFFTSAGRLTDNATTGPTGEGNDLYRFDVETGVLSDLTPDIVDPNGADVLGVLGASSSGSHVYFAANGVLTSTPNAQGELPSLGDCTDNGSSPGIGSCNLYLWHDGSIDFIARQLAGGTNITYEMADSANWLSANTAPKTSRVTPDGRSLLFRSRARIGSYDSKGVPEFYLFNAESGEIRCITCNPTGVAPVGTPTLQSISVVVGSDSQPAAILTRNLSASGDRVFFETPDKLVANDTNGDNGCPGAAQESQAALMCQDVYEWEAAGAGSCPNDAPDGGCVYLLSSGRGPEASYFADAGASGRDAFFFTVDRLVGQDRDDLVDIYDARVGGGLASQNLLIAENCVDEEACRPAVEVRPSAEPPGTSSFSGPANPHPCKKGKVRKHGKCVKKAKPRTHKKHHQKRHGTRKQKG